MKILVTGSNGLVGRELVRRLRDDGHHVEGFDLFPPANEPARDIRDVEALRGAIAGCDGVYHLAAVSRVGWGEADPDACAQVNVDATALLVAEMAAAGAPWLVFASSREVYGDPDVALVQESAPIAPVNAYGRSKADAEKVVDAARAHGLRASIVRLSNVYGTVNDHPDRAVPALLWRALHGLQIELTGAATYFDFVHVDDSVEGLVRAGDRLAKGSAAVPTVHLATGVATSLETLAKAVIKLCGSPSAVRLVPARTFDVSGFCGDPTQAGHVLDWRAKVTLDEGLARLRVAMIAHGSALTVPQRPAVLP